MSKFCPYCGNPVKKTDKYCIICGKPLLVDIPKTGKQNEIKETSKKEDIKIYEEESDQIEIEREEPPQESIFEREKKKSKKKVDESDLKPLPEEVKEQIVYYIEYNDIQLNKTILIDRLDELSKLTKDPKYEYDIDFKKEINVKLEAIKTLISELKEKESAVKKNLKEPFIVQKITNDIDSKIFQLENLSREHKLHKVDKETFEKLRDKYKEEKSDLEKNKEDLLEGMKLWIQDLKLEKAELSGDRKLSKGRFHAKEISEEEFKEIDKDFEIRLKKIDTKIETLEKLTK
ncbi:MAG: zinc ribbon domain-containing protein [Candidatus Thorarchaeota archaeon]